MSHISDVWRELDNDGRFAITHTGQLESDGKEAPDAWQDALAATTYFLSFARGAWSATLVPKGIGEDGRQLWEQWSNWRSAPHRGRFSWLSDFDSHALELLAPGFWQKWSDDLWKHPLRVALSWYFEANDSHGVIESRIIACQSALELLSWTLLVKDRQILSATQFKRKTLASDKIRKLLSELSVPLELPEHQRDIRADARVFGWCDAPHALTDVRNMIAHPRLEERTLSKGTLVEVWQLGLRLTELSLLSLMDYKGPHLDRTVIAEFMQPGEPVPWAVE